MTFEILIELIERCIAQANEASKECKSADDCPYTLGVHEGCISAIENYINRYKEDNRNGNVQGHKEGERNNHDD